MLRGSKQSGVGAHSSHAEVLAPDSPRPSCCATTNEQSSFILIASLTCPMEPPKKPPSLTNDQIIQRCRDPGEYLFAGKGFSNHVVYIDRNWVVKDSAHPSWSEAQAQQAARRLLDPSLVYVPQVYSDFEHNTHGYIIMERVPRDCCPALSDSQLCQVDNHD